MTRIPWLDPEAPPDHFPPVEQALREPRGLLVAGGDLTPARLRAAYARGIFPWYSKGEPILWWSPDPREVLYPQDFHRSRSLQRRLRSGEFRITQDTTFAQVMGACAEMRAASGTWITAEMQAAYVELHQLGHAHSVETWAGDELVGGLYGVRSGRVFCGESMFSHRNDASKAALAWLAGASPELGIELIDCQTPSEHLRSLGSQPMPRAEFIAFLNGAAAARTPP